MNAEHWGPINFRVLEWSCRLNKDKFGIPFDMYCVVHRNGEIEVPNTHIIGFTKYAGSTRVLWRDHEWGVYDLNSRTIVDRAIVLCRGRDIVDDRHQTYRKLIEYVGYARTDAPRDMRIDFIYPISQLCHIESE